MCYWSTSGYIISCRNILFFDIQELNDAIAKLLVSYNDYLFSHGDGSRRSHFTDWEKEYLSPLPCGTYSIHYYRRGKVQKTAHVYLSEDRNYYSVPFRFTGMYVEVQYNHDIVEIFYNYERIALHKRSYKPGHYTTTGEHMPSSHQAYNQWSPEYFQDRAKQIGLFTLAYIERLLTQYSYPEIAYKQSLGILSFIKLYNQDRLEKACKRGLEYHKATYHTIANILKNRLDMVEVDIATGSLIPEHDNIRGQDHYK